MGKFEIFFNVSLIWPLSLSDTNIYETLASLYEVHVLMNRYNISRSNKILILNLGLFSQFVLNEFSILA